MTRGPSSPSTNANGPGPLVLRTLLGKRQVPTALICLTSIRRALVPCPTLVVHDDGTLDDDDLAALADRLGPDIRFLMRSQADGMLSVALAKFPALERLRQSNNLMLKLLDVLLLGSEPYLYFVDADVIAFRRLHDLFPVPLGGALFMRDFQHAYALAWNHAAEFRTLQVCGHINTGLIAYPRAAFEIDYLEWIARNPRIDFHRRGWFFEQTAWAALAARLPAWTYDPSEVAVVGARTALPGTLALGHFVSSFRGRLTEVAGLSPEAREPTALALWPARLLSPLSFLLDRGAARLKRAWPA